MMRQTELGRLIKTGRVSAEILSPGVPTPTAADAARTLGVAIDRIIKSLLFVNRREEMLLAVITGDARVDRSRLQNVSRISGLKLARPEFVLEHAGYPVGSMPPIGLRSPIPTFVDLQVAEKPLVYGGGGVADKMIAISPGEIIRVSEGTVADIVED